MGWCNSRFRTADRSLKEKRLKIKEKREIVKTSEPCHWAARSTIHMKYYNFVEFKDQPLEKLSFPLLTRLVTTSWKDKAAVSYISVHMFML